MTGTYTPGLMFGGFTATPAHATFAYTPEFVLDFIHYVADSYSNALGTMV